ncbi:MAG: type II and III secretion system protein family protein [Rhizobiaceae bacterium]|nr:type II and III secretion system protein family protein [Rhizobiaceae bacterium]
MNRSNRALKLFAVMAFALGMPLFASIVLENSSAFASGNLIKADGRKDIKVVIGKPKTFRSDLSFEEIVVGDPAIADVQPLTDRSFYLLGSKLGTTRVALFDKDRNLVGSMDVEVTLDARQLGKSIKKNVPRSQIKVTTANGRILLSGTAKDSVSAKRAEQIASQFSPDQDVINSVSISSSQQVQLQVRFIEASRDARRKLGVRVGSLAKSGSPNNWGLNSNSGINIGEIIGNFIGKGMSVDLLIDAMEKRGIVRTLAEPNLVARSGEKASFLAGGEIPIPVAAADGVVSIEFKEFGIGLKFTPTVLDDGLISMVIEPEVSQVDPSLAYDVGNIRIPGFSVRRAKTSVDLRSGQSFVIAGLLQTKNTIENNKLPGLGNLPILGALFSSKEYRKRETDLIIVVTPHLVKPIVPGNRIASPLDKTLPPSMSEFGLLNSDEINVAAVGNANAQRQREIAAGVIRSGHIIDLPGYGTLDNSQIIKVKGN